MVTCVFTVLLSLHDTVLCLPFGLYSTFVVEQKHGFNKTVSGVCRVLCDGGVCVYLCVHTCLRLVAVRHCVIPSSRLCLYISKTSSWGWRCSLFLGFLSLEPVSPGFAEEVFA